MLNLIKADLYKETRKKSFIITLLIIIFVSIFYVFVNRNIEIKKDFLEISPVLSENEYKEINKYGNYTEYKSNYEKYYNKLNEQNKILKQEKITKSSKLLKKSTALFYILGLIIIFNSYHSISYDLRSKTIRYLFQSSYKRETILLSKILTQMILTIFYMLIIILIIITSTYLLVGNMTNIFNYLIIASKFLLPLFFIIIFTITLCLFTNASNLTIFISIIIYLFSLTFTNMLLSKGYIVVKYTFLPYLDFTFLQDISNLSLTNLIFNTNINYSNSIIIFSIYSILFILLNMKLIKKDL